MLLRRMPENGVCVEIGVWKGDFSDRILRLTRPRELYLIDPWAFQPQFPKRMYSGNLAAVAARHGRDLRGRPAALRRGR